MNRAGFVTVASLIVFCFGVSGSLSAPVQFTNRGTLNTWGTKTFERQHQTGEAAYSSYLKQVRVEKHKGFDRTVFEFSGTMPNYNFHYLAKPYYSNEDESIERIRIAGHAFIQAGFYFIRADETQLDYQQAAYFFPKSSTSVLALPSTQ